MSGKYVCGLHMCGAVCGICGIWYVYAYGVCVWYLSGVNGMHFVYILKCVWIQYMVWYIMMCREN